MDCLSKWEYEKPELKNYSAFGVFGEGSGVSGDNETQSCVEAADASLLDMP